MGRLVILMIFYCILLFENGTNFLPPLIDLGSGLEIRPSLLIKILLLVINIIVLLHFDKKYKIPLYLIVLSSFLLISTLSVIIIDPDHFVNALAVNIHIQLMLNIILFIRLNSYSKKEILVFIHFLKIFALVNAILVIISYFFPDLFNVFEYHESKTGVIRAFGIMGDEVSVFLSFFLYEAFVSRKPVHFIVYLTAILMTAGLGASFTMFSLFAYHLLFQMKKTRTNLYLSATILLIFLFSAVFSFNKIKDLGIIKRLSNISENTMTESVGMRLLSFKVAFDMIKERPLWGYGYGNYGSAVIKEYEPKFKDVGKENFFHGTAKIILKYTFNPYLQMMAESGLIGLIFFIWFLLKMLIKRMKELYEVDKEMDRFNMVSRAWLIVFIVTTLSANWFLPSSFLLLLVVSLVGINDKIKYLYLGKPVQQID